MKKWLAILLLSSASVWADTVTTGVIKNVEVGDYYHIVLKDGRGRERSFFVSDHKSFAALLKKPAAFKGKRVRLHWRTVEKYIPEAGGKLKIEEATSMVLLKPGSR